VEQQAAKWLQRFHDGTAVSLDATHVTLESSSHSPEQLERMWHAALLNELLYAAAHEQRRAVLEQLLA